MDKLALILDLDATLIQSAAVERIQDGLDVEKLVNVDRERELYRWPLNGMVGGENPLYIKLRPGLRDFLNQVRQLYNVHIFSLGDEAYVNFVCQDILDPERHIFKSIRNRSHAVGGVKTVSSQSVKLDVNRTVILDDKVEVWETTSSIACIKAYPFDYFGKRGLAAKLIKHIGPASYADRSETFDFDEYLPYLLKHLQRVYISMSGVHVCDMRTALRTTQQEVLTGIRVHLIGGAAKPSIKAAVKAFGGTVEETLYAGLHIVVTQGDEEFTIQDSGRADLPVVDTQWLIRCFATFQLEDYHPFEIKGRRARQAPCCWESPSRYEFRCGTLKHGQEVFDELDTARLQRWRTHDSQ